MSQTALRPYSSLYNAPQSLFPSASELPVRWDAVPARVVPPTSGPADGVPPTCSHSGLS